MIKVTVFSKDKGQKNYRKSGDTRRYSGTISFFQSLNPEMYDYRDSYSNFGQTYTRIVKNKQTGQSLKTIVEEY